MTVTFLGTGTSQGVPMIACNCAACKSNNPKDNRLRSSVLININDTNIIIDTGTDFRQQMLREHVTKLDAVLFTHEHKDHTAGLDDIRAFNYFNKKRIPLYISKSASTTLISDYNYVFNGNQYPGIPELDIHIIDENSFNLVIDNKTVCTVQPIAAMHYKLPVLGFRINDFTYITDANYISDQELLKLKGTKTLVLNALRHEKHISHFTLSEAIELANKIQPEQTYFTHISHQLGLYDDVMATLPNGMALAYDGLKINLD